MSVRVRFAPSPTGNVHIGNIRAAIFNWLFARHAGGKFLLRVEDTDRERSTQEAIDTLLGCMAWLGLDFDEPTVYQSRQMERHLAVAEELVRKGFAYRDAKGGGGECVIFRMPKEGRLEYTDLVKGTIKKKAEDTQDFVIVRSDGTPVFHLSNVVDDIDMAITHVIRGDDHVENTFKHIELFKAIGAPVPLYAHLPMIVNNQGKPYSKRDGAAFVGEFKEQGYLPDALFNFLLLLGWAPGDDREVLTREEMIQLFTLDHCKSSPARFDIKKLDWMNGEYIRRQSRAKFAEHFVTEHRRRCPDMFSTDTNDRVDRIADRIVNDGARFTWNDVNVSKVVDLMQVRTKFYAETPSLSGYFFNDNYNIDEKAVAKRLKAEGVAALLEEVAEKYAELPVFDLQTTHDVLAAMGEARGTGLGSMVHPVRVAVSGLTEGPGLFEMLVLLGRDKVCARLRGVAKRLRDGTL